MALLDDSGSGDVVIKMVLKGIDPEEAARLAAQTGQSIEAEIRASLQRQQEAYANAAQVMSAQGAAYAKQEISQSQDKTAQLVAAQKVLLTAQQQADAEVQKMGRAQAAAQAEDLARTQAASAAKIAALRSEQEAHQSSVEVLRGVAESGLIAYEAVVQGLEKLKELGEQIVKNTQIYNSLGGSVEEAKEKLDGTVTTIDLIIARNKGAELGLKLSGEQFANVAAQAHQMAIATGTDGAEALNKLITGLALGKTRALDMAGVIIDADKAHQDFAKSIGTTADQLSDEGKRTAVTTEALAKLAEMAPETAKALDKPMTVAEALEKAFVGTKNAFVEFTVALGNFQIPAWFMKFFKVSADQAPDAEDTSMYPSSYFAQGTATVRTGLSQAPLAAGASYGAEEGFGDRRSAGLLKAKAAAGVGSGDNDLDAVMKDAIARDQETLDILMGYVRNQATGKLEAPAGGGAEAMVNRADYAFHGGTYTPDEQKQFVEAQGKMEAFAKQTQEQLNKEFTEAGGTIGKAGDKHAGVLETLIYGQGGPTVLYDQMTETQKRVFELTSSISKSIDKTSESMTSAVGESLAAMIGEHKPFLAMLKEKEHAILQSLASQALGKAAWETAEGLASLALSFFDPAMLAPATAHFLAAAAYGAVGGIAAVGARATYSGAAGSGSSAATGTTPTSTLGPSSTDSGSSTSTAAAAPVNIYMNVAPGGEEGAGRSILKALQAYKAQTGMDLSKLLGSP